MLIELEARVAKLKNNNETYFEKTLVNTDSFKDIRVIIKETISGEELSQIVWKDGFSMVFKKSFSEISTLVAGYLV